MKFRLLGAYPLATAPSSPCLVMATSLPLQLPAVPTSPAPGWGMCPTGTPQTGALGAWVSSPWLPGSPPAAPQHPWVKQSHCHQAISNDPPRRVSTCGDQRGALPSRAPGPSTQQRLFAQAAVTQAFHCRLPTQPAALLKAERDGSNAVFSWPFYPGTF